MGQHADHLVLYQCGLPQAQLAPPLWLLHTNRRPEPVHRSHVYSYISVLCFPVEPAQCYARARQRLSEFDMYFITSRQRPLCLTYGKASPIIEKTEQQQQPELRSTENSLLPLTAWVFVSSQESGGHDGSRKGNKRTALGAQNTFRDIRIH